MVCANCGKNNKDGATHCANCGAALARVKAQDNVQKAVDAYGKKPAASSQKNTVSIIIIVFLCLILVVTLALLAPTIIDMMDASGSGKDDSPAISGNQAPTEEEGFSPSNPYFECYRNHPEYVLPNSSSAYLSRADLKLLNKAELTVALQEIYARHGYQFRDKDLQDYFNERSWYSANGNSTDFNTYEIANQILLEVYIAQQTGEFTQAGNPYLRQFTGVDSFALPNSQSRYLEAADLKELKEEQLIIARSEIYARHGMIFSDLDLHTYFCTKSWYVPTAASIPETSLNEYEANNVKLIQLYERKLSGGEYNTDNPYMDFYLTPDSYLLSDSDTKQLLSTDLTDFTIEQCVLARSEIYARHGLAFHDEELQEYFLMLQWYEPGGLIGDTSKISLSSTEKQNVALLEEAEKILEVLPELEDLDHSPSVRVSSNMYSVKVPAYWERYAKYTTGNTTIRFDEYLSATSTDSNVDGHLTTISVVAVGEDNYPGGNYTKLGILSDADGNQWEVLAAEPSDVRSHPCALELYAAMTQDLRSIYGTITPAEGFTYTPN